MESEENACCNYYVSKYIKITIVNIFIIVIETEVKTTRLRIERLAEEMEKTGLHMRLYSIT